MISKETAQKVINMQLEGVMFHSDMADLFLVLGNHKMRKMHNRQMAEELENMQDTKQYLMEQLGELISPAAVTAKIKGLEVTEKPDESSCIELTAKTMSAWYVWEANAKAIYEKALAEDNTSWWRMAVRGVTVELNKIKRLLA